MFISLTPHKTHVDCEAQSEAETPSADGAPADEMEIIITPEMIEAGAIELASFSSSYDDIDEKAIRIFEVMLAARPKNA